MTVRVESPLSMVGLDAEFTHSTLREVDLTTFPDEILKDRARKSRTQDNPGLNASYIPRLICFVTVLVVAELQVCLSARKPDSQASIFEVL